MFCQHPFYPACFAAHHFRMVLVSAIAKRRAAAAGTPAGDTKRNMIGTHAEVVTDSSIVESILSILSFWCGGKLQTKLFMV
jgi:hypothetical protein